MADPGPCSIPSCGTDSISRASLIVSQSNRATVFGFGSGFHKIRWAERRVRGMTRVEKLIDQSHDFFFPREPDARASS